MTYQAEQTDPSIGNIIARINNLDAEQIDKISSYQKEHGLKFGEAAVALGLAKREDVVWALSQQFNYPYKGQEGETVSAELVVATDPFNVSAEFFRDVRSQLLTSVFSKTQARKLALAVCSADAGDGKSFFSANLAVAFSQLSGRTLLIDADMRTPRQQSIFGVNDVSTGLSSVLAGRAEDVNVLRPIEALPNLFLLPVGIVPPNPLELIQGQAFEHMIASVLTKFDYVIVDTPAAVRGADARVLAAKSGASVIIGRRGVTAAKDLKSLADRLSASCEVFCGVLMNSHKST